MSSTYTIDSLQAWRAAAVVAKPLDTLRFDADLVLPADTIVPAGVLVDLNRHTVSPPPPDVGRPGGYRLFDVSKGGIEILNGMIQNAGWGVYAFYSCRGVRVSDVLFSDVRMAAIKLSATREAMTDDIRIEDCRITAAGTPQTLIDLGPGAVGATLIRGVSILGPPALSSNTACDGIAVENGQGGIQISDVSVANTPGDGIDVKNSADLIMNNIEIEGARRNGLKIWCHSTAGTPGGIAATATVNNAKITNCGLEHIVIAAGTVVIDGLTVEAPGAAAAWGGGYEYPCDITVKNASIVRTGDSSSWLMHTDGGDGRPISSYPAKVRFERCRFWAGLSNNVFSPKAGSPLAPVSKQAALTGQWPSNFVDCTYAEAGPVVPPPPPPPETTLEQRIAALEIALEETRALATHAREAAHAANAVYQKLREALK